MTEEKQRIEVNWVQSIAGALAAVTSAVLLSTVGVAGTLIGAALGSIAATLGSAVYSYYLRATKDRVETVALAASRISRAQAKVRGASRDVAAGEPGAQDELSEADAELQQARVLVDEQQEEEATESDWRTMLAGLPWKRIAIGAAGIFVAAMTIILAFELATGRAVSSYTGGSDSDRRTSIPGLGGGAAGEDSGPVPEEAPPTSVPSEYDEGGSAEPGSGTSATPEGTATEETEPSPSIAPSSSPAPSNRASPTSVPSATAPAPEETP